MRGPSRRTARRSQLVPRHARVANYEEVMPFFSKLAASRARLNLTQRQVGEAVGKTITSNVLGLKKIAAVLAEIEGRRKAATCQS